MAYGCARRYVLSVSAITVVLVCLKVLGLFIQNYDKSVAPEKRDAAGSSALNDVIRTLDNVSLPPPALNVTQHNTSNVTLLVLVTYQRSGSSFLGELFNQNPDAFVWFEPLDGVYSALYGTGYGYNVPADLWSYPDGTERQIPEVERRLLAASSAAILQCEFWRLPTEVLLHHFVLMFLAQHRRLAPYAKCVQGGRDGLAQCQACNTKLSTTCPLKFNGNSKESQMCANELAQQYFPGETPFPGVSANNGIKTAVKAFTDCMAPCRQRALKCVEYLRQPCLGSTIRSIKPVRLDMQTAGLVRAQVPGVKLLHNLRDPRGVVHSRKHTSESFQSAYALIDKFTSKKTRTKSGRPIVTKVRDTDIAPSKEARLFCRDAARDVRMRRDLERQEVGSTLQVVYEHYAAHPLTAAADIYAFLGRPLPTAVSTWLRENTAGKLVKPEQQTSRDANQTLAKWQAEFSVKVMGDINMECSELYKEMDNVWPYT